MYLDGTWRVLEVRNATPEETGVYTVKAVSDLGEAVSSTTLYVIRESLSCFSYYRRCVLFIRSMVGSCQMKIILCKCLNR